MNLIKFTLRLVTTLCYFLPFTFFFVTCQGLSIEFAYNEKEAERNILLAQAFREESELGTLETQPDTTIALTKNKTPEATSDTGATMSMLEAFRNKVVHQAIRPTNRSLSGISAILLFKTMTGKILLATSFLLLLTSLLAYKFFKGRSVDLYFLLVNSVLLTVFMIHSFGMEVSLLWGFWMTLFLLFVQCALSLIPSWNMVRKTSLKV